MGSAARSSDLHPRAAQLEPGATLAEPSAAIRAPRNDSSRVAPLTAAQAHRGWWVRLNLRNLIALGRIRAHGARYNIFTRPPLPPLAKGGRRSAPTPSP